jgi:hypothetical protein
MSATVQEVRCLRDEMTAELRPEQTTGSVGYKVIFDGPSPTNAVAALTADDGTLAIPTIGDELQADSGLYARSISVSSVSPCGKVVTLSVNYATSPANMGSLNIDIGSETENEIMERDPIDDTPIVNSAGTEFADPAWRDVERSVLVVERTEALTFDGMNARIADYNDHVNSHPFQGREAKYWKLKMFARRVYEARAWLWRVHYEFRGNPMLWTLRIQDRAVVELTALGKIIANADDNGNIVNTPIKLDGSGQPLDNQGDEPYYVEFNKYLSADFNDLALPFI